MSDMPELYWSPEARMVIERREDGCWPLTGAGRYWDRGKQPALPADAVPLRPVEVAGTWAADQEQAVAEAVDDVQHKLNADELERVTESVMRTVLPWLRPVEVDDATVEYAVLGTTIGVGKFVASLHCDEQSAIWARRAASEASRDYFEVIPVRALGEVSRNA